MGFYVSPDGSDVTRSLVDELQKNMKMGKEKGYALVSVSLSREQLNEARQDLWRRLADHHQELDTETEGEAPETYGIGKVDYLPESCLRLQVLPCFRKIFGHLLQVDPDSLVSTFDVPQYVPPGRDQRYMGLSIGTTSVVGLLCLTSQFLTPEGTPIPPGTLVLYDTRALDKHRTILPKNPTGASKPWIGLRIGFWPSHADKFGIPGANPSLLRQKMFLEGRFGLHFEQSPHADPKEIARLRRDFLQQNADSRFLLRSHSERCPSSISIPHARQLYFDHQKGMLKWMSQTKEKQNRGILQPLSTVARDSNQEIAKSRYPASRDKENLCPPDKKSKKRIAEEKDKPREELITICREMVFPEPLSPLPPSPVKKRKRKSKKGIGQEPPEKCVAMESTLQKESHGNSNEEGKEFFLTDLVYDSMYEDSDSEVRVVHTNDFHPISSTETPDLKSIPFDREIALHKHIPIEKLGVFKRKQPLQISTQLTLSKFLFCCTGDLGNETPGMQSGPVWNSKEMEDRRSFCTFQSLQQDVYEVRGARDVMDLLRILVIGMTSLNKNATRANSYFSVKELFDTNENLASVPCEKNTLYSVIRVPKEMVGGKNQNSYFNLKDHQRKTPRREWKDVTMTDSALKAIEWNDRARKILGENNDLFDARFPGMIGKEMEHSKMICKQLKTLCRTESKAALKKDMPVYCHVLSVEQVLDKHSQGVEHILGLCRALATPGANKDTIWKDLTSTLREQFQLINLMRADKNMSIAYRVYGLSPRELFMQVICPRLGLFKQLVMAVKEEYENQ